MEVSMVVGRNKQFVGYATQGQGNVAVGVYESLKEAVNHANELKAGMSVAIRCPNGKWHKWDEQEEKSRTARTSKTRKKSSAKKR
jgi:hypothetical protein